MLTIAASCAEAVAQIEDGATVMIGGFGVAGQPVELIDALIDHGATDLTVVNNNAGNGDVGLAKLIQLGRVRRIICSFPRQSDSWHFDEKYRAGEIELEVVPQGNLAERIRAAGAGIGAFFTPTGYGTPRRPRPSTPEPPWNRSPTCFVTPAPPPRPCTPRPTCPVWRHWPGRGRRAGAGRDRDADRAAR